MKLNIERQVVGWLLKNPDLISEIGSLVPGDFTNNTLRELFETIKQLDKPDMLIIKSQLPEIKYTYLVSLLEECIGLGKMSLYVETLLDQKARREIRDAVVDISKMSHDTKLQDVILKSQNRLGGVKNRLTMELHGVREVLGCVIDTIGSSNSPETLKTGISSLDDITGGFESGNLVILGGRPSEGKTQLGVQFAVNMALENDGLNVVFISLEMKKEALVRRMIGYLSKVSVENIKNKNLNEHSMSTIIAKSQFLAKAPIMINDRSSVSIPELKGLLSGCAPDIVFVDYLQLMNSGDKTETRHLEI